LFVVNVAGFPTVTCDAEPSFTPGYFDGVVVVGGANVVGGELGPVVPPLAGARVVVVEALRVVVVEALRVVVVEGLRVVEVVVPLAKLLVVGVLALPTSFPVAATALPVIRVPSVAVAAAALPTIIFRRDNALISTGVATSFGAI